MSEYTWFLDLANEVRPPDKGILSRTLYNDGRLKAVAFGFAQGEALSEHTASMPAVLHFRQGEAEAKLTPGHARVDSSPGASGTDSACRRRLIHRPPDVRHDDRDVVLAALPVGLSHQPLASTPGVTLLPEQGGDAVVGDHPGQAVRTQQQHVAGVKVVPVQLHLHPRLAAPQQVGDDMPVGVPGLIARRHNALADQFGRQRVVPG